MEEYLEQGLTPIAISGVAPCFYDGIHWKFFAPSWDIFSKWKNGELSDDGYVERFIPERLEILNKDKVKKELSAIENPILLCYEKEGFCHRHVVADWLREIGFEVEEF